MYNFTQVHMRRFQMHIDYVESNQWCYGNLRDTFNLTTVPKTHCSSTLVPCCEWLSQTANSSHGYFLTTSLWPKQNKTKLICECESACVPPDPEDITCCCRVLSNEAMNKDQLCVSPQLKSISVSIPEMSLLLDIDKWSERRRGRDTERWREMEGESKGRWLAAACQSKGKIKTSNPISSTSQSVCYCVQHKVDNSKQKSRVTQRQT